MVFRYNLEREEGGREPSHDPWRGDRTWVGLGPLGVVDRIYCGEKDGGKRREPLNLSSRNDSDDECEVPP
jgi:hypothetical protein